MGEKPVFVTPDGRPRRRPRWLGRLVGLVLAAWVISVVVGASGFATVPALRSAPLPHLAGPRSHGSTLRLARLRDHRHHVILAKA
jgi:hypothetical protein